MNYEQAFKNMAKAINGDVNPAEIGQAPEARPRSVEVPSETLLSEGFKNGSIAGRNSARLLDKKDHFPIFTETQARSSFSRAMQLSEVPSWYSGNMADLRKEVWDGIVIAHPAVAASLSVNVPVARIVALSDGETPAETGQSKIKDPADVQKSLVPGTKRPTLTSAEVAKACEDETVRLAFAGKLMECIEQQEADLQNAKKLASTLMKKGVAPDQFDCLSTYLQSDILRELLYNQSTATASTDERRRELLERMNKKD